MKVGDLVTAPLHTVSSDRSVQYAANQMNELRVGSLIVSDYGITVGIITSRDVRAAHPNRIVADAMTRDPIAVSTDCFIWNAWSVLEEYEIERLLVKDGDRSVGIVTRETLYAKLCELRDPLTGLYRGPYIQNICEDLLAKRIPFQLVFIDLNNFGEINKKYGHPVGDDVIIDFSGILKLLIEPEEYMCRYAGDEFVVISRGGEQRSAELANQISMNRIIRQVEVSAAVGSVEACSYPDFFDLPFRELIGKASLLCTDMKRSAYD